MSVLLALVLFVPAPDPKPVENPVPKGLAELQGVWKATALESRGVVQAAGPLLDRYALVVVGTNYVLRTHAGTLRADAEKKTVDMTVTEGAYSGTDIPGIFELKGDTLRLAFNAPTRRVRERPKDFKTGADTTHMVYTFERVKTATKEQAAARLKELREGLPGAGRGVGGRGFAPERTTQDLLRQVLEKLDRIEKRLDDIEKKGKGKE